MINSPQTRRFLSALLIILVLCLGESSRANAAKRTKKTECQVCKNLVNNFIDGLKKTAKGNFGGGNTAWEDSKLGNYRFSETRFEEIIEQICKESECHELLENQEEKLFAWFKSKQDKIEAELLDEFCTNEARVCCPSGKFGSKCDSCPTAHPSGLICSGRGSCEGDGTRGGKGECLCESAYSGKLCDECRSGHYEQVRNDTHLVCSSCHESCESCNGPDADACITCKTGWTMNKHKSLCEDVDECLNNVCNKRQFCQNMEGSYECISCDPSCAACSGPGPDNCVGGECNKGYRLSQAETDQPPRCVDINECEEKPEICSSSATNDRRTCVNTPGSYECKSKNKSQKKKSTLGGHVVDRDVWQRIGDFILDDSYEKKLLRTTALATLVALFYGLLSNRRHMTLISATLTLVLVVVFGYSLFINY